MSTDEIVSKVALNLSNKIVEVHPDRFTSEFVWKITIVDVLNEITKIAPDISEEQAIECVKLFNINKGFYLAHYASKRRNKDLLKGAGEALLILAILSAITFIGIAIFK